MRAMPPKIASIVDSLPSENRRVSATWLPVLATWVQLSTLCTMCREMVALQEIPAREIRDDTDTMTRALLHIPSIAGSEVRIVTPVYVVATKLEAFQGRGSSDVTASHDLEDILTVVGPTGVGERDRRGGA